MFSEQTKSAINFRRLARFQTSASELSTLGKRSAKCAANAGDEPHLALPGIAGLPPFAVYCFHAGSNVVGFQANVHKEVVTKEVPAKEQWISHTLAVVERHQHVPFNVLPT